MIEPTFRMELERLAFRCKTAKVYRNPAISWFPVLINEQHFEFSHDRLSLAFFRFHFGPDIIVTYDDRNLPEETAVLLDIPGKIHRFMVFKK